MKSVRLCIKSTAVARAIDGTEIGGGYGSGISQGYFSLSYPADEALVLCVCFHIRRGSGGVGGGNGGKYDPRNMGWAVRVSLGSSLKRHAACSQNE